MENTDDYDAAPSQRRRGPKPAEWTNRKKPLSDVSLKKLAPQFEGSLGSTYSIIDSGKLFDDYVERGDINLSERVDPHAFLIQDSKRDPSIELGAQLIQMCLPHLIANRVVPDRERDGGILWIWHTRTARICKLTYTNVIWSGKGRELLLFCSNFTATAKSY